MCTALRSDRANSETSNLPTYIIKMPPQLARSEQWCRAGYPLAAMALTSHMRTPEPSSAQCAEPVELPMPTRRPHTCKRA